MNNLKQSKVKTLTIYTRQQILSYFQEFKSKINLAYDKEDLSSIKQLLFIVKLTIILFQVPQFAIQLNQTGDIQITAYLEALYVKNNMWKFEVQEDVKSCVVELMNMYQREKRAEYKMGAKFRQVKYKKLNEHFSVVYSEMLTFMYQLKEQQTLSLGVTFLKVLVIHMIQSKANLLFITNPQPKLTPSWTSTTIQLINYCRLIDSIKKQQTAISLCYWMCLTQKQFIPLCVNQGVVSILKRSLTNKNISESYGLKVVGFLRLLVQESEDAKGLVGEREFQQAVVRFSQKHDSEKVLSQLRELMLLSDQRKNLSHKQKLQLFHELSQNPTSHLAQLKESIHLLNLYSSSNKVSQPLFTQQQPTLIKLITQSTTFSTPNKGNLRLFKQIFSIIAYVFGNQKGTWQTAEQCLKGLKSILSVKSQPLKRQLLEDRKKVLINFIKMVKEMVCNKKYHKEVIQCIRKLEIERLFLAYSDCTNFMYERELVSLRTALKSIQPSQVSEQKSSQQRQVLEALQKHMIQNSLKPIKKVPGQDQLQQIKLLYQLVVNDSPALKETINNQLIQAINTKTSQTISQHNAQSGSDSLKIFETGQSTKINQIKTQINLYSIKLFNQLFKSKQFLLCLQNQKLLIKNISIGLNTSNQQILNEVVSFVIQYYKNFNLPQHLNDSVYDLWKKALQKSGKTQQQGFLQVLRYLTKSNQNKLSPDQVIRGYFKALAQGKKVSQQQQSQFYLILNSIEQSQLKQYLSRLSEIQPPRDCLLQYLTIVHQLSKRQSLKLVLFKLFSSKLKTYYAKQIQSANTLSHQIKNKVYLILSQIVKQNIKQNPQYFNDFIRITLMRQYNPEISVQSLVWIERALESKQLTAHDSVNKVQRKQELFKYVESEPQMIGIQCGILLQYSDKQVQDTFVKSHKSSLLQTIGNFQKQSFMLNFLLKYSSYGSNTTFVSCNLIQLLDKLLKIVKDELLTVSFNLKTQGSIDSKVLDGKLRQVNDKLGRADKRSLIVKNWIIGQKVILSQDQYLHVMRQTVLILSQLAQIIKNITLKTLPQQIKEIVKSLIVTFLTIFIQIQRFPLQSKQLDLSTSAKLNELIPYSMMLQDSDINQKISELMRLIVLKDREREGYEKQKQIYDKTKKELESLNTSKGLEHLRVVGRVLLQGREMNRKQMNRMIAEYFLVQIKQQMQQTTQLSQSVPSKSQIPSPTKQLPTTTVTKSIPQQQKPSRLSQKSQLSESQLIRHMKSLLNPPYKYGINTLTRYLKRIQSKEYVEVLLDVFILSSKLYEEDLENKWGQLQDVREKIIENVHEDYCDVTQRFYIVIDMGKQAAKLCLRRLNIGLRGVEIICARFIQSRSNDDLPLYAQILTLNALSFDQLNILHQKGISSIINQVYPKKSIRPQFCIQLGNLIGSSSKLLQIQQQYKLNSELLQNLVSFRKNQLCLAATLNAIAGLVYCNEGNQKFFGSKDNVQLMSGLAMGDMAEQIVTEKGFKALANLIYKNKTVLRTYLDQQLQRKTLKMLQLFIIRQFPSTACIRQMLRLLGMMALSSQGGFKLVNLRFLDIAKLVTEHYLPKRQLQIVRMVIDVVFNISNQAENDNRVTIQKMEQQGVLAYVIGLGQGCLLSEAIISSILSTVENLFGYEFILQKGITSQLVRLLEQVSHTQQNSQEIFLKWSRLLYIIFKSDTKLVQLSLSNLLFSASTYLKAFKQVDKTIVDINMYLLTRVRKVLTQQELLSCGWVDFLIENLKLKNQLSGNIQKILDILLEMSTNDLLSPYICTKLFQILIKRLEYEYRDDNAYKLILLLTKIREKITITSQSGQFLLQFSCFFLTQKEIILSPKYHKRVRQIISVLGYFIAYNIQLKIVFREESILSILKDWIRIDTLIETENSIGESCRLCLFGILNQQSLLVGLRGIDSEKEGSAREELEKGNKCVLYRRDGSSKGGVVRLDKGRGAIVAYKHPNGQIKGKYCIPLSSILSIKSDYSEDQQSEGQSHQTTLFSSSVFKKQKTFSILSSKPRPQLLLTIIGMVGSELSVRQINVQFNRIQKKERFVSNLKLVMSAQRNRRGR